MRAILLALITLFPMASGAESMYNEKIEWGIPPSQSLQQEKSIHSKTPSSIPGARVIRTEEVYQLITSGQNPLIIYVGRNNAGTVVAIPGSIWVPWMGSPELNPEIVAGTLQELKAMLAGRMNYPIVTYCTDPMCWLSYNAALRLSAAGFTGVRWYRGGLGSWETSVPPLPAQGVRKITELLKEGRYRPAHPGTIEMLKKF